MGIEPRQKGLLEALQHERRDGSAVGLAGAAERQSVAEMDDIRSISRSLRNGSAPSG
jgi:hypothetical protein